LVQNVLKLVDELCLKLVTLPFWLGSSVIVDLDVLAKLNLYYKIICITVIRLKTFKS
jgi:hypothetical protein